MDGNEFFVLAAVDTSIVVQSKNSEYWKGTKHASKGNIHI